MTFLEELTPEQLSCIEELKKRTINDVTPKMLEDPSLFYRFSKARNFNLKQAEAMLRKSIAFRKEYKVDTILEDYNPPEILKKYTPSSHIGFDKDGNPVRFISMPDFDVKGYLKSVKKLDVIKFNILLIEQDVEVLRQQSEKLGKLLTTIVYIYDYNKMTFATATHKEMIELMLLGANIYQDNYPERVKSVLILNASIYYMMLFSVIKSVVAAALLEKLHIYGTEGWQEVLREIIDPEVLPAFLGGKKTDPDGNPLCNSFIIHGQTIPEHYYLQKSQRTLYQEPGVKKLNVTRFSSSNITFEVDEPGSILEWEFETKSKDIGFSVSFKDKMWKESKTDEIVPKQRIDTCYEPESGMFKCEKSGTYIITFDNSYSWLYPKEIYYRISIRPPEKLEAEE